MATDGGSPSAVEVHVSEAEAAAEAQLARALYGSMVDEEARIARATEAAVQETFAQLLMRGAIEDEEPQIAAAPQVCTFPAPPPPQPLPSPPSRPLRAVPSLVSLCVSSLSGRRRVIGGQQRGGGRVEGREGARPLRGYHPTTPHCLECPIPWLSPSHATLACTHCP